MLAFYGNDKVLHGPGYAGIRFLARHKHYPLVTSPSSQQNAHFYHLHLFPHFQFYFVPVPKKCHVYRAIVTLQYALALESKYNPIQTRSYVSFAFNYIYGAHM